MMAKTSIILTLIFILSSCSTIPKRPVVSLPLELQISAGDISELALPSSVPENFVTCDEIRYNLAEVEGMKRAWIPLSYFSKENDLECFGGKGRKVAIFKWIEKTYPEEKLNVNKRRVFLSKKDRKRVRTEQKFLNKNYASSPQVPLFNGPFMIPLNSYVTSKYGSRRLFNKKKRTQHLGTDYRAAVGTPIPSAHSGRVVVSRELFYTGLTVTVDHGMNIFTVYGHLSKLKVKEGDEVGQGEIIGLAGATGRVTGPHLHWGVKAHGHWVDGASLVRATSGLSLR